MTRADVAEAVRDALRAARWARRARWHGLQAIYLADAARWRGTLQMMINCGMPCLPLGYAVHTAVYPPF